MRHHFCHGLLFPAGLTASTILLSASLVVGQEPPKHPASSPPVADDAAELRGVADSIRELQEQVEALKSQMADLRSDQRRAVTEAQELRRELALAKGEAAPAGQTPNSPYSHAPAVAADAQAARPSSVAPPDTQNQSIPDRVAALEENQQFIDAKVNDQYQTKVESASKYRVRLSGILLMNLFENRGTPDNQDFPSIAVDQGLLGSPGAFGGSLRQSQIGLEAFGPEIAGAHTSAEVRFDFAGGFADTPNGSLMGLVRLRTGIVRMDWAHTSIVAGQDYLFFAPLEPTSYATLATPALSYAGNLWGWTPQVRVEHHIEFSDNSSLSLQGGILDSLSGDSPESGAGIERSPQWGEQSGQLAYGARVAWTGRVAGQKITLGAGGFYGRQNWGFSRKVDSWAGTTDLTLPLGQFFQFTGEFYRGRAVAGLGGAIGQDALMSGSIVSAATTIRGLDSEGGWAQLKFKPKPKFEVNGAFGQDSPFASEIHLYPVVTSKYGGGLIQNRSWFVNFIYQPRSDMLFSTEFRRLKTNESDGSFNTVNHLNLSVAYIF